MLQGCGTEHIVYTMHCCINGIKVSYITYNEVNLRGLIRMLRLQTMTHLILLLFIT